MGDSPIRSVDRALEIVEALSKHGIGLGLVELSNIVDLNKSTTYRMLCALMAHGWVAKDPLTGNYRLTLKVFEIGSRLSSNILKIARPFFEELSEKIKETIHLVVQEDTDVVYLYKDESIQNIKMGSRMGMRNPMYITAVGKVILSYLDFSEQKRIWDKSNIVAKTNKTIVSFDEMLKELAVIKERGWAIDDEENEVGVRCIAVPVLNKDNFPIAAISVSGSVFHLTEDKYEYFASVLADTARKIAIQLGT